MTIEPGTIYALREASDYPYCLCIVLKKRDHYTNHILIIYRPEDHRSNTSYGFAPDHGSLYSILQQQGRLDDLIPFIRHLKHSQDYLQTAKAFNIRPDRPQQAPHYSGELVPPPPSLFRNKLFLPYTTRIGLGDLRLDKLPSTFL